MPADWLTSDRADSAAAISKCPNSLAGSRAPQTYLIAQHFLHLQLGDTRLLPVICFHIWSDLPYTKWLKCIWVLLLISKWPFIAFTFKVRVFIRCISLFFFFFYVCKGSGYLSHHWERERKREIVNTWGNAIRHSRVQNPVRAGQHLSPLKKKTTRIGLRVKWRTKGEWKGKWRAP